MTTHFHTPTWASRDTKQSWGTIQIFEKKKINNGKCSRSLLFERNAPFWSDLQLKFSVAVGETKKKMFNF